MGDENKTGRDSKSPVMNIDAALVREWPNCWPKPT
jgi:hypothetical protein